MLEKEGREERGKKYRKLIFLGKKILIYDFNIYWFIIMFIKSLLKNFLNSKMYVIYVKKKFFFFLGS